MSDKPTILTPLQRLLGEDFNPALLLIMIRKSILWCILILLVTTSLAFLYLRYNPPTYEANASLIVKPINTAQALNIEGNAFQTKNSNIDIEKDIQIMKSNMIIDRVIDSLQLQISYYIAGNILNDELYKTSPFKIEANVTDPSLYDMPINFKILSDRSFQISYLWNGKEETKTGEFGKNYTMPAMTFTVISNKNNQQASVTSDYFFIINNPVTLYSQIRSALQVAPNEPTIGVLMRNRKPQKAADIVNRVCEEFIRYDKEKKTESATLILNFIESQVDSISNDLHNYEDQMTQFKLANGIAINGMEEDLNNRLNDLKTQLNDLDLQYSTLEYYRKYFLRYQDSTKLLYGIIDPQYSSLNEYIKNLDDLQGKRNEMLLKLSPNNPEMINLNQQISDMKHNVLENIKNAEDKVHDKSNMLDAEVKKNIGQFSNVPGIQAEYLRLSRLSDLKEKYYMLMLDKKSAFSITKAGFVSDYTILRGADVPSVPVYPNTPLIRLLGLVTGLLACFILIITRYLLHNKILSVSEIMKYSDAGLLGVIPKYRMPMDVSQLVVNKSPKSVISECFRSMRTNLDYISPSKNSQLMTVTSTVAGEGKTFIAVNMAGILAVGGKKVILLDFDLRKPQIHKAFAIDNQKGISTLLIGKHQLDECIRHSEWENLDIITSGPLPPSPAEFILSKETEDLISQLKQQYDMIVIDTPPVGIVTDALELIKKSDFPVYIVRADYSSKNFLNNINHLVNDYQITKLSVVLNDMGEGASIYSYNYGYGYGYGYAYRGSSSQQYGGTYYTDDLPPQRGLFLRMISFVKSLF